MNRFLKQNPFLWAGLLSFALSLGLSFHDVVNSDGILYLNVARAFSEQNYGQALSLYGWAFYPALIAITTHITSLSLEHSAILLNASFMALMASGFVMLTHTLGGSRSLCWVASFIFLIHPGINGYREYIVRDFGAWAGLIWSLVFLCRFSQKPSWGMSLCWSLSVSFSVLFRPEAFVWLMLGPVALFMSMQACSLKQRLGAFIQIHAFFLAGGLAGLLGVLLLNLSIPATKLHNMLEVYGSVFTTGVQQYADKAQAFSELMSIYFKFDHALVVLGIALVFYTIFLAIKLLSPLYSVLLLYGSFHRPLIPKREARILIWFLCLYAGIYFIFVAQHYFISSRYIVPWVTVSMIWVPFVLEKIWPKAPGALKATIGLIMAYMILDSLIPMGHSKMYLKEAGLWVNQHTPAQARLYTDSNHVAYYANRPLADSPDEADVIALKISRKSPPKISSQEAQAHFHNEREDGIQVFILDDKID